MASHVRRSLTPPEVVRGRGGQSLLELSLVVVVLSRRLAASRHISRKPKIVSRLHSATFTAAEPGTIIDFGSESDRVRAAADARRCRS